jgi:hypothetical protein
MWFAINVLPLMEDARKPKSSPDQLPRPERWADAASDEIALVRLVRKFADVLDGVNLQEAKVGDRLELPRRDANVLVAEGWAERVADERRVRLLPGRTAAADSPRRSRKKRKK